MALSFLVFSFQFPVIKNLQHVKHSKNKLNFCRLVGAKFALKNQGSKRTFFLQMLFGAKSLTPFDACALTIQFQFLCYPSSRQHFVSSMN
ncbi:MAG: hypothetical protein DRR19_02150 [Candidatus Parabeggiatoa sp. nov. 1]|nr:MAG: hypothetical protein DRR19_02150 [Gammaproteobacteria bacterium]